ncbi:hypothetical protein HYPSUDRAFT_527331 [Hypholoma sublateritium FD-334 SS-4]|uniref:NAD(P)-binding protein n=1 Tax=Hypholoma sublateritium (strain FD-334 SS-4) TaxID=945553 RepID=A0A0D2MKT9_HYPSF|nr:hypothetical protein HYPSUDRAFT_527331 [Hypholoma sublateritium FD-334 SS-4]
MNLFAKAFDPQTDLQDMTGRVVIVTGANQGIGYATAKHLARKGARVYLGARSEEKGRGAVARLEGEGVLPGAVVYFACDLSTPAQAKAAALGFLELEARLDVLVNNAACIFDYADKSALDGITEMMMTNHFGTFQFTLALLPLLEKTAAVPASDVRIVTVSSERHRDALLLGPAAFADLSVCRDFHARALVSTLARYALSKLANVLFSTALHRRLTPHTRVISLAVHPGIVATSFPRHLPLAPLFRFLCALLFKAPDVGAYNTCWAAAAPGVRAAPERYGGAYVAPVGRVVEASRGARDEGVQDALWTLSERYLAGEAV